MLANEIWRQNRRFALTGGQPEQGSARARPAPNRDTRNRRLPHNQNLYIVWRDIDFQSISPMSLRKFPSGSVNYRSSPMQFKTKLILPAVLLVAGIGTASAACEVAIEGDDAMKYNLSEITVDKSCDKFTVTLKHVGKLPKAAMGHNWILVKTADFAGVSADALKAGAAADYLPSGDARVIAATKLIGGGESASVTFETSKLSAGEGYTFFCSFPAHSAAMKGTLKF
jgi:azurin